MRVSLIQMDVAKGSLTQNEEKAKAMLSASLAEHPDVVCLPELWNTGYDLEHLEKIAQKEKDSSLGLLKRFAKKHKIYIIGGSIAENHDGKYCYMMPLITPKGSIELKYRKTHLFPLGLAEDKFFYPGDQWGIGEINEIPVGMMLCYDLRFPAFCRNMVLRGAKVVFVSAQWPKARLEHWRILLSARAIENQIFIVAVNRVGEDESGIYMGHSMVIDPFGKLLAVGNETEAILSAELDMAKVEEARTMIPALSQRLNILDEIDNNFL